MSGIFVTVEGPEGSGKTTLIQHLLPLLQEKLSVPVIATREPGGNEIAEHIRSVILHPSYTQMDARTEALLYAAARRQHLVDNLLPSLAQNTFILCDRFVDSSIAYQGVARQIGIAGVRAINQFATDGLVPDLTLYIDIPVAVGLQRIHTQRQEEINRLDLESMSFHESVRSGYLMIAQEEPERVMILDGLLTPAELVQQSLAILEQRFENLFNK